MAGGEDTSERGSASRDRKILCQFHDATGGLSSWNNTSGWKSDRPMGEWHGVETNSDGRVVSLVVPDNSVEGIIPETLGGLNFLQNLNLRSNALHGPIPKELADLKGLRLLRLGNNSLNGTVPSGIGFLEDLVEVDLGNNELGVLPMDLVVAWALATEHEKCEVALDENPWARPPASTMSRGLKSAECWWKDVNRFGEEASNKLKIVIVGLAGAGKTTIVRHFTGRNPPDERTIGVEVTEWKPRDYLPLSVSLWDFAGQSDYYASHQIFLTKGALFVLVVDLFELVTHRREGVDEPRGAIFRWLDILHERVPGAHVALVGTHTDKFLPLHVQDNYIALMGVSRGPLVRHPLDVFSDPLDSSGFTDYHSALAASIGGFRERIPSMTYPLGPTLDELFGIRALGALTSESDFGESQDQLAKAEELFNSLVQRYMREATKEIELSRAISRAERNDNSERTDENSELRARGTSQQFSSARNASPVPLIIHDNIFRVNMLPQSVNRLSEWIVDAAAESDPSNAKAFSFPAVRVIVPSAWIDAIAAVEALGTREGRPYVMWGEAVEEFQRYFREKHNHLLDDADSVLKRAMQHREAEGAVILSLQEDSSPAPSDMIHLDPRWLIELARRVTDHNLVDKSKQGEIKKELRAYFATRPPSRKGYSELWEAHKSFIRQGRLDREYLRFLWLYRTLEDKDTYSGVTLDDESFESMLATMIKCLFIYRSHASESEDGREWFIVPARLPEYGNEKILEDCIWFGEVVVQTTATFQRSHAPCGIIGRFLAFSASKIMASGECWQHGAHIRWETGHEVLVCETFSVEEGDTFPGIAICVKGSTPEAMCVRKDVKDTLLSLIENDVHGYPGLCFPEFNDSEPLVSNEFQRVIRAYLDIKFASLAETLEKIGRDSRRMFHAAFPSSRDPTEYPRLVVLVPDESVGDSSGNPEDQSPRRGMVLLRETWDRWMKICTSGKRSFRLVFLCQHDFSEVPCGPDGKGYPVQDAVSLFMTLKPLLQGTLWLVRVAVGCVANVDLPLHEMLGALVNATADEILSNVASVPIPDGDQSVFNADAKHTEEQSDGFKDLHGSAHESLCTFMRKQERKDRARCCTFFPCLSRETLKPTSVDWRDQMVQVENGIGGWAWVLKDNEQKYRRRNGSH